MVTLYKLIRFSAFGARLYLVTRHKGSRLLVDTVVVAPPFEWQIENLAWDRDGVEGSECFQNNNALLLRIPWFAERVTKRPLQVNASWRLYLFRVLTYDRYSHGGDSSFFDLSLYQSHGLIADASSRGEQDDVNLVLLEFFNDLFCCLPDQGGNVPAVDMAHE